MTREDKMKIRPMVTNMLLEPKIEWPEPKRYDTLEEVIKDTIAFHERSADRITGYHTGLADSCDGESPSGYRGLEKQYPIAGSEAENYVYHTMEEIVRLKEGISIGQMQDVLKTLGELPGVPFVYNEMFARGMLLTCLAENRFYMDPGYNLYSSYDEYKWQIGMEKE